MSTPPDDVCPLADLQLAVLVERDALVTLPKPENVSACRTKQGRDYILIISVVRGGKTIVPKTGLVSFTISGMQAMLHPSFTSLKMFSCQESV
jgi:hypothetical protein